MDDFEAFYFLLMHTLEMMAAAAPAKWVVVAYSEGEKSGRKRCHLE